MVGGCTIAGTRGVHHTVIPQLVTATPEEPSLFIVVRVNVGSTMSYLTS